MFKVKDLDIYFWFKHGFSEIDEFEMPLKGYRNDIIVVCPNGKSYSLCFYDNVRLSQDIEYEKSIFEQGLVVVQTLNIPTIEAAIKRLWNIIFLIRYCPCRIRKAK